MSFPGSSLNYKSVILSSFTHRVDVYKRQDQDPPAVGRQELGGGAEGQPEDAGVDEGQQLLGPESGRAGDQAGKTAVHVDLEVDV